MKRTVFDAIESGSYNADEAIDIDTNLSKVSPAEVPDHQLKSMIDYLDFRFLHGAVAPNLQDNLHSLHKALSDRYFAA